MSQPIKAFCLHYVVAFQCNVGNWMEQRCMVESKVRYEFIWILCLLNKCRMIKFTSRTVGYTDVFSLTCLGQVTRKSSHSKGSEPEEYLQALTGLIAVRAGYDLKWSNSTSVVWICLQHRPFVLIVSSQKYPQDERNGKNIDPKPLNGISSQIQKKD